MRFGSVCSGIEAASVAWNPLGWQSVFFSEIEAFPSAILAERHPDTPNYGDMTQYENWPNGSIDLLVGGTPCQSFSVAGLRKGLGDPRGNLMLTFGAIAAKYRPQWLVWENVPGVLSSNKGRDFGTFLGMLGQLRYGFAYRVLDAQYFGVAQRRRRVFVVGCLGNWRAAAAVLFERHSLSGHPAPRRETRQTAPIIPSRSTAGGGLGTDFDCDGGLISLDAVAAGTLTATYGEQSGRDLAEMPGALQVHAFANRGHFGSLSKVDIADSLRAKGGDTGHGGETIAVHGTQDPCTSEETAFALGRNSGQENSVCFVQNSRSEVRHVGGDGQTTGAIAAEPGVQQQHYVRSGLAVRRLTPVECERLQGFFDNYTRIRWRGKGAALCPDGPRYKAIGNSMAVPVMHWIGERIDLVELILSEAA